jgi:hypothetical protein
MLRASAGRPKVPVHADDTGQPCADEIKIAHHGGHVSRGARDGNVYRAINLHSKLINAGKHLAERDLRALDPS